jgi:anti-sigma B factor antagonist
MELNKETIDAVTVVAVVGEVNAATAPSLDRLIREEQEGGQFRLVIDLSQAGYVSSAGMRVLLVGGKSCRRNGGDLRLAGLPEPVKEVFDMAGFSSLFELFDDAEAAVVSFSA